MKITKRTLQELIKEEIQKVLRENKNSSGDGIYLLMEDGIHYGIYLSKEIAEYYSKDYEGNMTREIIDISDVNVEEGLLEELVAESVPYGDVFDMLFTTKKDGTPFAITNGYPGLHSFLEKEGLTNKDVNRYNVEIIIGGKQIPGGNYGAA